MLAGYSYQANYTVTNNVASVLDGYSVLITLSAANFNFSKPKADFSDVRVTDTSDNILPFWVQAYSIASQTATIWVRVPHLGSSGTATVRIYAGNANPATMNLPPTGKFTRPAASQGTGLVENMVKVSSTYYAVTSNTTSGPVHLWSASSPTGTWTDLGTIVDTGGTSAWDRYVYAPHLVTDGTNWYCFYSGAPTAGTYGADSIGYAVSTTGITGTYNKYVSNPVIPYSGTTTFDHYRAVEPYVFQHANGTWYCVYMGDNGTTAAPNETIGFATASAITGPWTKQQTTTPAIGFGAAGSYDGVVVADPWVAGPVNGAYIVGYSCTNANTLTGVTAYAITYDFVNFYKQGPILGYGKTAAWDVVAAFRGAPYLDGTTWYFPYTGFDGVSTFLWGVASLAATGASFDPWSVIDFTDDFPGSSLDTTVWGNTGTAPTVGSGVLNLTTTTTGAVGGTRAFGVGYMTEMYCRENNPCSSSQWNCQLGFCNWPRGATAVILSYATADWQSFIAGSGNAVANLDGPIAFDTNWHTRRVWLRAAADTEFKIDDAAWTVRTAHNPLLATPPYIYATKSAGSNPNVDVDYVRVRQYVEPEPSVAFVSATAAGGAHARGRFPATHGIARGL